MFSGLDTETLIQDLMKAKRKKNENLTKEKTKLEWKQTAWQDLNKELKSLYTGTLGNLRYSTAFRKKATTASNSAISVITGENAMNSVQSLSVTKLAKTGYLTGSKVQSTDGSAVTASTLVKDLTVKDDNGDPIAGLTDVTGGSFTVTTKGKTTKITIDENTTMANLTSQLNAAGVNANFDEKNGRLFIGATASGLENDFTITADNAAGFSALSVLGINVDPNAEGNANVNAQYTKYAAYYDDYSGMDKDAAIEAITTNTNSEIYKMLKAELDDPESTDYDAAYDRLMAKIEFAHNGLPASNSPLYSSDAVRLAGDDAEITLNGATFTSSSNTIEVNGLTITANAECQNVVLTTQDDTDGIYDVVKDFLKKYNEIIKKMDKLYNADAAKGYDPLSDEEKDAMSDSEIEKWETKIKDSLFRKDSTLGSVFNALKDGMNQGIEVNGRMLYLGDFGIGTQNYFEAAEGERAVLHIDGDKDDGVSSGNADKLKSMIATDPDAVVGFFTKLSASLYDKMHNLSGTSSTSSFGSFFEDKQMKTDIADYTSKIAEAEEKLNAYEDRYYNKFSKMEVALSKLQSQTSYLSGLFGGGQ
jgi:flagellar hook-associated protein 2